MKTISYTTNLSPTVLESYLTNTDLKDSQFFIKRSHDYMYLDITYHEDFDPVSVIYSVDKTKLKTKVYSNTTDILATDIIINGVAYYYLIESLGGTTNYKQVVLNSGIECIEYKGKLYTNEVVVNLELKDNMYIFTKPVIDMKQAEIKYRVKDIELIIETLGRDIQFKCLSDTIINPTLINNSKAFIPSFYVKKDNKIVKCLEGDIAYVAKKEYVDFVGNFITTKDLIHSYDGYFIDGNIFYPYFYFGQKTSFVEYVAKLSSHVFYLQDAITYFKVKKNGLDLGTVSDYDFYIEKKIDISKFQIYLSEHLTTYKSIIQPSEHYIVQTDIEDSNKIVGLKNKVNSSITRFPSESYYIINGERVYYQHNNAILPTDTSTLIKVDSYTDTTQEFNTPTEDPYDGFICTKIQDTYYYRRIEISSIKVEAIYLRAGDQQYLPEGYDYIATDGHQCDQARFEVFVNSISLGNVSINNSGGTVFPRNDELNVPSALTTDGVWLGSTLSRYDVLIAEKMQLKAILQATPNTTKVKLRLTPLTSPPHTGATWIRVTLKDTDHNVRVVYNNLVQINVDQEIELAY